MYRLNTLIITNDALSPVILECLKKSRRAMIISMTGKLHAIIFAPHDITGERMMIALNRCNSISLLIPV